MGVRMEPQCIRGGAVVGRRFIVPVKQTAPGRGGVRISRRASQTWTPHPHVSPLVSLQWGPENSLSKFPVLLTLLSKSYNLRNTALEGLAHG